jgi:hypothetical protein
MTKVIAHSGTDCLSLPEPDKSKKQNSYGLTTGDYRRILTDLRQRPPTQRAFLRKLLKRALATNAASDFPVPTPAVQDPVRPS